MKNSILVRAFVEAMTANTDGCFTCIILRSVAVGFIAGATFSAIIAVVIF